MLPSSLTNSRKNEKNFCQNLPSIMNVIIRLEFLSNLRFTNFTTAKAVPVRENNPSGQPAPIAYDFFKSNYHNLMIYIQLARCSISGLSLVGPTKVKARKYFLFMWDNFWKIRIRSFGFLFIWSFGQKFGPSVFYLFGPPDLVYWTSSLICCCFSHFSCRKGGKCRKKYILTSKWAAQHLFTVRISLD